MTYNKVLRVEITEGCLVIGYADDILIVATANSIDQARLRANLQTALVVNRIHELGLKIAANKTKVILFHGPRRKPAEMPVIRVEDSFIPVSDKMKYLRIIMDSRWFFRHHLEYEANKASKVAKAVDRLMPNLRSPLEPKRKLYGTVVLSVILYGAPLWSEAIASQATASQRRAQAPLNQVQRFLAVRIIAAYRTVSYEAATVLARSPPIYLLTWLQKRVFERLRELRLNNEWTLDTEKEVRLQELTMLRRRWKSHLQGRNLAGVRVREVVFPILDEWLRRNHGKILFHLTQVITGHGCHADYLFKIGKRQSATCDHCGVEADTAQHTIEHCAA